MRAEDVRIDPEKVEVLARTEGGDAVSIHARLARSGDWDRLRPSEKARPWKAQGIPERSPGGDRDDRESHDHDFRGQGSRPRGFRLGSSVRTRQGFRIGMLTGKDSADMPGGSHPGILCRGTPRTSHPESIRVKAIAQGLLSRTFSDRVIALGEAAGQIKTTTGGGIYYGLVLRRHRRRRRPGVLRHGAIFRLPRSPAYEKNWKSRPAEGDHPWAHDPAHRAPG